ncbi:MAG TPA: hypothetical protein VFH89_03325 [Sphingomicrobium sp.]|nr:hypothetical protein [Sphingomicrobium sp.]
MTDEPQQGPGDERPKFFNNVTGWIGGLTAVVLALAGLKAAAGQLDLFGSSKPVDTAVASNEGVEAGAEEAAGEETAADLPTKYAGTWQGQDVTLEWRNGVWVEVTAGGTDDEVTQRYEQLERTDKMTNGIDRSRDMYVRWPTQGGTLEESEDGKTWTESYDVAVG